MRTSVFWVAVLSRVAVIGLQCVANHLLPDHEAGVFRSPKSVESQTNAFDWPIEYALGGFRRWDAEYFLHIAEYGYTYENTLAFFPLYPLCVRLLGQSLLLILPVFSLRAILLLAAVLLNVVFFGKAAEALYDLTRRIFRNRIRAKLATVLFCLNPASVFFSAPYSESLYCWLTFAFFRDCLKEISVQQTFPLSLSIMCRSNGLINVFFLVYVALRRFIRHLNVHTFLTIVFKSAVIAFFVLFHFGLLNAYHFYLFCHRLNIKFAPHIRDYAEQEGFVLAGNKTEGVSPWCASSVPMAYGYVQDRYWNVGFLRYYEFKQLPNFLLAAPLILVMLASCLGYAKRNWRYSLRLGLFVNEEICGGLTQFDQLSFVFLVHAAALTVFCALCIHVQVTTRMLASSSPVLYWVAANTFKFPKTVRPDEAELLRKAPRIFNPDEESDIIDLGYLGGILLSKGNRKGQLFLAWFLMYAIIGTILFSNFLPWT